MQSPFNPSIVRNLRQSSDKINSVTFIFTPRLCGYSVSVLKVDEFPRNQVSTPIIVSAEISMCDPLITLHNGVKVENSLIAKMERVRDVTLASKDAEENEFMRVRFIETNERVYMLTYITNTADMYSGPAT